jgi:hypothetical protein
MVQQQQQRPPRVDSRRAHDECLDVDVMALSTVHYATLSLAPHSESYVKLLMDTAWRCQGALDTDLVYFAKPRTHAYSVCKIIQSGSC